MLGDMDGSRGGGFHSRIMGAVDERVVSVSLTCAFVGGVALAADQVVSVPRGVLVVVGVAGFFVGVWGESRRTGVGLVRTAARATGSSLRLLWTLLTG